MVQNKAKKKMRRRKYKCFISLINKSVLIDLNFQLF